MDSVVKWVDIGIATVKGETLEPVEEEEDLAITDEFGCE